MTQSIILLHNSPLVRGMFRRIIDKRPGLRIVAEVENLTNYSEVVQRTGARWTILLLDPGEEVPDIVEKVLNDHPTMRLLAMAVDGSQVRMKWIEPHEELLVDSSLEDLLNILSDERVEEDKGVKV